MKNYDQWKTASPYDDVEDFVEFVDELKALGRRGHGLCGKDADLDPGGQIRVISATLYLDRDIPEAIVEVEVYANICCPVDDERAEIAEAYVMDETSYHGEWTGSDYWCFSLDDPFNCGNIKALNIKFPDIDPLVDESEINKNYLAQKAYDAIFGDAEIRDFRLNMADLLKMIDEIN